MHNQSSLHSGKVKYTDLMRFTFMFQSLYQELMLFNPPLTMLEAVILDSCIASRAVSSAKVVSITFVGVGISAVQVVYNIYGFSDQLSAGLLLVMWCV